MTERDYIVATNVAYLRAAEESVRQTSTVGRYSEAKRREITILLRVAIAAHEEMIRIK